MFHRYISSDFFFFLLYQSASEIATGMPGFFDLCLHLCRQSGSIKKSEKEMKQYAD